MRNKNRNRERRAERQAEALLRQAAHDKLSVEAKLRKLYTVKDGRVVYNRPGYSDRERLRLLKERDGTPDEAR